MIFQIPAGQEELFTKARQMLYKDEEMIPVPYDDADGKRLKAPVGFVTIGVGHNLDAKPLPLEIVDLLLYMDIEDARQQAMRVLGAEIFETLTLNRKLAFVNLAFNLGEAGLSKFKKMLMAVRQGDYEWAGRELRDSLWAVQVDPKRRPDEGRDDRVIRLLTDDYYEY